jgi:hypothetical protein
LWVKLPRDSMTRGSTVLRRAAPDSHEAITICEGQDFFGAIETGVGHGRHRLDGIARFDLQRRCVDGHDLFGDGANPNGCAVGREIGAAGSGDIDLSDARAEANAGKLDGGGEDFDTIHRAVGDEKMLVDGVVDDVAVVRFAGRIVGSGGGIGSGIGTARAIGDYGLLDGKRKCGGMR